MEKNLKTVATNKKAFHEYFVEESLEAGIALTGTEIKSVRAGGVSLKEAWCSVDDGEMFVKQMHIAPYDHGNIFNRDPLRPKKLLMHKREIMKINGMLTQKGYTLVPLSLYFSGKNVKVELGLCRGKKLYDKRDALAEKQAGREMDRRMKEQSRYD